MIVDDDLTKVKHKLRMRRYLWKNKLNKSNKSHRSTRLNKSTVHVAFDEIFLLK